MPATSFRVRESFAENEDWSKRKAPAVYLHIIQLQPLPPKHVKLFETQHNNVEAHAKKGKRKHEDMSEESGEQEVLQPDSFKVCRKYQVRTSMMSQ